MRHVEEIGPNESARVTAGEVLRYFEQAAPRHQDDEDNDLFPLVLTRAREARLNGETDAAQRTVERLGAEHRALDGLWPGMRGVLDEIHEGIAPAIDWTLVRTFVCSNLDHHAAEDQIIGPLALRLLTPEDLGLLGHVMATRRGTTWDALSAG